MIKIISVPFISKATLFAAAPNNVGDACKKADFLGLHPWWYYLPKSDFDLTNCNIKNFNFLTSGGGQPDLPLVLLAIVDDLLRIAGIVAVAFVIVGAFRYVASQGNPEDTAKAQSTIINALIGTAVAIVAAAFVNFLGQRLGGG